MFYFYALPAEPFLVLAVVYVLGAIMSPVPAATTTDATTGATTDSGTSAATGTAPDASGGTGTDSGTGMFDRRVVGAVILGAYVLVVAACFAYFYPIYTGEVIPYSDWSARMWLGGRWI